MRASIGLALALAGAVLAVTEVRAETSPVVVELFTSEGCSSCPPAEALLGELAERADVIALAYHVDYWDGLGWKDRFSLAAATARQKGYYRSLGLSTLYTPQMVVDGATDVVGYDRPAVEAALKTRHGGPIPRLTRAADGKVVIELPALAGAGPAEVTLVGYSPSERTKVARGENAGCILVEAVVVRGIIPVGRWDGGAKRFEVDVSVLPDGAAMAAVLVQAPGQGAMVGAATLALR